MSQQDFLARIDGTKSRINQLSNNIAEISNIHQRMLSSPDNNSTAQLESIVSETQIRNTQIKDEIKFLEKDAAREPNNSFKRTQVESLKRTFKKQLEDFQKEESDYSKRYREAIARQYRIVNPDATEQEVQEASNADWGDEGIFQQAVSLAVLTGLHERLLIYCIAQNQPHRSGGECTGRCARPPQRHSAHRADTGRAGTALPAIERSSGVPGSCGRAGRATDTSGAR
jgi:hypothetical protein